MRIVIILCMSLIALPVCAGTLIDDFDDGNLDGWIKSGNGKWEVIDGRCKISILAGGSCALLMIGEPDWGDYTAEMELQANQAFDYIGFRVRVQDFQNGYPWIISCSDNTARWYTHVNDWFSMITIDKIAGDLVNDKHTFKAVAKGNKLQGYYDGKHINTVRLDHFKTGKVLIGICGDGPSSAFFDNVIIAGDDIPDMKLSLAIQPEDRLATIWGQIRNQD